MILEIFGERYPIHWPRKKPTKVYIRYGLFSNREVSSNHATGEDEKGISAYPAEMDGDCVTLAAGIETCESLKGQGRLCFPITGREVATGSDGEPVLRGVRILPYALHINTRIL